MLISMPVLTIPTKFKDYSQTSGYSLTKVTSRKDNKADQAENHTS